MKYEIVLFDDWVAYCVDGEPIIEGHKFEFGDGFRMKEKYPDVKYGDIKFREATEEENKYADTYGSMPNPEQLREFLAKD